MRECTGCHCVVYCNKLCQTHAWTRYHRRVCRAGGPAAPDSFARVARALATKVTYKQYRRLVSAFAQIVAEATVLRTIVTESCPPLALLVARQIARNNVPRIRELITETRMLFAALTQQILPRATPLSWSALCAPPGGDVWQREPGDNDTAFLDALRYENTDNDADTIVRIELFQDARRSRARGHLPPNAVRGAPHTPLRFLGQCTLRVCTCCTIMGIIIPLLNGAVCLAHAKNMALPRANDILSVEYVDRESELNCFTLADVLSFTDASGLLRTSEDTECPCTRVLTAHDVCGKLGRAVGAGLLRIALPRDVLIDIVALVLFKPEALREHCDATFTIDTPWLRVNGTIEPSS